MNEIITRFINGQKIATVCCTDSEGRPYCFHCFYAFNEKDFLLYYKSSPDVRHSLLLKERPYVAGTIQPNKLNPLAVQGVQFEGMVLTADDPMAKGASRKYHIQHPYAVAVPGEVYTLRIDKIKMTDNTKGFGKKLHWEREAPKHG